MTPERIKQISRIYHRQRDEVDDTLTEAMCEVYRNITGKIVSDRMREEIGNAIRYNA